MSAALSRCLSRVLSRQAAPSSFVLGENHPAVQSPWFAPVMTLKTSAPLRSEPMRKKKKINPRIEILARERLKKRLRKLEKIPAELIPIEDFITPVKFLDETRVRAEPTLSFEESERRALLLKEWNKYKWDQYLAEKKAIRLAFKAEKEALWELRRESENLYKAALLPDHLMLPFTHEGPTYTPPITKYEAPEGKFNNITKVYTQ